MYVIDRGLLIIKPKQTFVDWINQLPDPPDPPVTIADVSDDSTVYLIPEFDTPAAAQRHVNRLKPRLFAAQLAGWYTDESTWPRQRGPRTFDAWFDIEVHSLVMDLVEFSIFREDWGEL